MPSRDAPDLHLIWHELGPAAGDGPAGRLPRVLRTDDAETELAALYALGAGGASGAPHVRANMVATVDGAAVGPDGLTGSINDAADLRVFVVLRSLADVVLVGAGTARAEGYSLPRVRPALRARRAAAGQPPAPGLAVVTRSGEMPLGTDLFAAAGTAGTADGAPDGRSTLVLTCAAAGRERLARLRDLAGADGVVVVGEDDVDVPRALDALAERGLRQVLCEGGPSLLGQVAAAGRLDELCLTTTPGLLGGDAPRALTGPLARVPLTLRHALLAPEGGGTLLQRWVVRR